MKTVTVALPILNGARVLDETLAAVRAQRVTPAMAVEVIVCDSGSHDESVTIARNHGAEVIEIEPRAFSHGATRNLLMQQSSGDWVAFLTQDAVPAHERWLAELLDGFALADDVGLVFGPYRPRPEASPMVARELSEWFGSFSPDGSARLDRLEPPERDMPARALLGPRGFFTDANGCVLRAAWESVPFRAIAYAEDHMLALDMMRKGYAKVFLPGAAVIHSHEYSSWDWLRRSFDEYRALNDIYGFRRSLNAWELVLDVWGRVGADRRWMRTASPTGGVRASLLARSLGHHVARTTGAVLGARAEHLPDRVVRRLSIEGRGRASGL